MSIEPFCENLAAALAVLDKPDRLPAAVAAIAGFFGVQTHEIGFFQAEPASGMVLLRWPSSSAGPVMIPLRTPSALVSATFREKRGFVNNAFATTPHLHMVEHSVGSREHRLPLQKIISAPDSELRWAVQVSRKGKTAEEAGADFTRGDLHHLQQIVDRVVPLL